MITIPKVRCPYCQESSELTELMSKEDILSDKELGHCPKCDHPIHLDISCNIFALATPIEQQLELLQERLDMWQQVRSTQSEDINLIKNMIKYHKDQIKYWMKVQKGGTK